MQSWTFSPDEFVHVWRETDLDVYPYPIRILETPTNEHDAAALHREIAARLPHRRDPDLTVALGIVAKPHTRIAVIGGSVTPGAEIRMLGAIVMNRAVLIVQDPGSTADFGGAVRITMGHSGKLGERIADLLPSATPGRAARRMASIEDLRNENPITVAAQPDDSTVAGQIRALLERPRSAEGHLRIEPRIDRHYPPAPTHFSWIDVVDDGRYLIKPGTALDITPATPEFIAKQIQKLVPR